MVAPAVSKYQAVQINTSSQGELLIALYDGLFRFLNVARYSLRNNKRGQASEALSKSHAIVTELYISLDHSVAPDLCRNLEALYDFSLHRIVQANLKSDANYIDEVIRVLTPVREAFTTVVRGQAAASSNLPLASGASG
jgi:flagellar protein FliS